MKGDVPLWSCCKCEKKLRMDARPQDGLNLLYCRRKNDGKLCGHTPCKSCKDKTGEASQQLPQVQNQPPQPPAQQQYSQHPQQQLPQQQQPYGQYPPIFPQAQPNQRSGFPQPAPQGPALGAYVRQPLGPLAHGIAPEAYDSQPPQHRVRLGTYELQPTPQGSGYAAYPQQLPLQGQGHGAYPQ
jgi:hypothetical protein